MCYKGKAMKYLKIMLNTLSAGLLMLFSFLLLYHLAYLIIRYPDSLEKCGPGSCPSLIWTIGIYVVFPFLIYKFGKYLYQHFFEQQSILKHLLILAVPVLMDISMTAWHKVDIYGLKGLTYYELF